MQNLLELAAKCGAYINDSHVDGTPLITVTLDELRIICKAYNNFKPPAEFVPIDVPVLIKSDLVQRCGVKGRLQTDTTCERYVPDDHRCMLYKANCIHKKFGEIK